MNLKSLIFTFLILLLSLYAKGQETEETAQVAAQDSLYIDNYRPLKPAKVAFYSAVLPGLGQAYNKDYWKIPIVYAAIGTGVGFAVFNHNEFQRYRTAYKDRIAGRIDEFTTVNENGEIVDQVFTEDNLIDAQDFYRRRKELSILITAGLYILQIIEANVDAHLSQYDVDNSLSFHPYIEQSNYDLSHNWGIRFTYNF